MSQFSPSALSLKWILNIVQECFLCWGYFHYPHHISSAEISNRRWRFATQSGISATGPHTFYICRRSDRWRLDAETEDCPVLHIPWSWRIADDRAGSDEYSISLASAHSSYYIRISDYTWSRFWHQPGYRDHDDTYGSRKKRHG